MRIAHVILTSRFAGSERYALELAAAQAAAGDEVHLLLRRRALQARPDALGHRVGPGVVVHAVPDWLPAWHGRRRLDALAPDAAHGHLSAGCRAVAGCRRAGARVATLHIAYKPRQHARLDGLVAIAPWQMAAIPEPLRARSVQVDNWTRPAPPAPGARDKRLARAPAVQDSAAVSCKLRLRARAVSASASRLASRIVDAPSLSLDPCSGTLRPAQRSIASSEECNNRLRRPRVSLNVAPARSQRGDRPMAGVDWQSVFVPTIGLAEVVVRGTIMYLAMFVILRFIARRQAGNFGPADLLVIGPYQGGHGCLRIPFSRGVCGAAARTRETQLVPDVHAFADHIACSSTTLSEIVVPVLRPDGRVLAVLDVDSNAPAAFDAVDQAHLESLCHTLGERFG